MCTGRICVRVSWCGRATDICRSVFWEISCEVYVIVGSCLFAFGASPSPVACWVWAEAGLWFASPVFVPLEYVSVYIVRVRCVKLRYLPRTPVCMILVWCPCGEVRTGIFNRPRAAVQFHFWVLGGYSRSRFCTGGMLGARAVPNCPTCR